jgi:hypothetical protein
MEIIVQSVEEARQVCHSARGILRHRAHHFVPEHNLETCACDICVSYRLLGEVNQRLGAAANEQKKARV